MGHRGAVGARDGRDPRPQAPVEPAAPADGSSGFSLSLSPSFSSISTTTSLHVFQVGRQDSMNLMPLHRPSRFGPRSNRCKHEFQRVRRLRPSENSLLEQRTKTSTILLAPKAAAFLGPRTTTEEHIYGCMSDDWVCIGKVIYLSILHKSKSYSRFVGENLFSHLLVRQQSLTIY